MTIVDFNGVSYKITTPQSKNVIMFSLSMQCFKARACQMGAQDMLKKEYGPYFAPDESSYDVNLKFDLQRLPEDKGL